jgi:hypothetical protein
MDITREMIEQRKADLEKNRDAIQMQIAELEANLNANIGAIADCEYWLGMADKQPEEKPGAAQ